VRHGAAEAGCDTRADARFAPRVRLSVLRSPVPGRVPPRRDSGDAEAVTELPASGAARLVWTVMLRLGRKRVIP
jgi:hypothetical protein